MSFEMSFAVLLMPINVVSHVSGEKHSCLQDKKETVVFQA